MLKLCFKAIIREMGLIHLKFYTNIYTLQNVISVASFHVYPVTRSHNDNFK